MKNGTKIAALSVLSIALGCAVIYCVMHVGNLNSQAAFLEACSKLTENRGTCPPAPISEGQVSSLHNTADTLGKVGWSAWFIMLFVVGGSLMDLVMERDSESVTV